MIDSGGDAHNAAALELVLRTDEAGPDVLPRNSLRRSIHRKSISTASVVDVTQRALHVVLQEEGFFDGFGWLGVPMVAIFVLAAVWTAYLAYLQAYPNEAANTLMNTTHYDNGEFWLIPQPDVAIAVAATTMLVVFALGYLVLAVVMLFFRRHFINPQPPRPADPPVVTTTYVEVRPASRAASRLLTARKTAYQVYCELVNIDGGYRQYYVSLY